MLVKTNSRPPANDHATPLGVADPRLGTAAIRGLFDTASQSSFVTQDIADKLNLKVIEKYLCDYLRV